MFLTRLGFNSKAVITGDITQIDLPTEKTSGLIESKNILQNIEGIKFVFLVKPMLLGINWCKILLMPMKNLINKRRKSNSSALI
jgi:hypothetical protein